VISRVLRRGLPNLSPCQRQSQAEKTVPCSLRHSAGLCSPLCAPLAFTALLDGMYPAIPPTVRGILAPSWLTLKATCEAVSSRGDLPVDELLGESFDLRAPAPVLSMVAVDFMIEIDTFFEKVKTACDGLSRHEKGKLKEVWFKALAIISYFKLPLHKDSYCAESNGRCRAVSCASLLTQPH
jgi:hypothetical protein